MFEKALLEIGFLPADNPEARFVEWRALFGRAGLTSRETRILLALGRRMKNVGEMAKRSESEGASRAEPSARAEGERSESRSEQRRGWGPGAPDEERGEH